MYVLIVPATWINKYQETVVVSHVLVDDGNKTTGCLHVWDRTAFLSMMCPVSVLTYR
jgi:hypothetical protein